MVCVWIVHSMLGVYLNKQVCKIICGWNKLWVSVKRYPHQCGSRGMTRNARLKLMRMLAFYYLSNWLLVDNLSRIILKKGCSQMNEEPYRSKFGNCRQMKSEIFCVVLYKWGSALILLWGNMLACWVKQGLHIFTLNLTFLDFITIQMDHI